MANQIPSFATSHLTLGGHYDFHSSVLALITELTPAALHIEAQAAKYTEQLAREEQIINRSTTYLSTAEKKAADTLRDRAGGVIMNVTDAHSTNPNPVHQEPAVKLKAKLAPYRGIWKHEYSKQTSEVNGLVNLLRSAECAPWVTALHLDAEVDILASANETAKAAKESKIDEMIDRQAQTGIETDQLRKEVDRTLNEIIQLVNAYNLIQPSEATETFVTRVTATMNYHKDIMDQSTKDPNASDGGSSDGGSYSDGRSTDGGGSDGGSDGTTPEGGETPDTGGSDSGTDSGDSGSGGGDDDDDGGSLVG